MYTAIGAIGQLGRLVSMQCPKPYPPVRRSRRYTLFEESRALKQLIGHLKTGFSWIVAVALDATRERSKGA